MYIDHYFVVRIDIALSRSIAFFLQIHCLHSPPPQTLAFIGRELKEPRSVRTFNKKNKKPKTNKPINKQTNKHNPLSPFPSFLNLHLIHNRPVLDLSPSYIGLVNSLLVQRVICVLYVMCVCVCVCVCMFYVQSMEQPFFFLTLIRNLSFYFKFHHFCLVIISTQYNFHYQSYSLLSFLFKHFALCIYSFLL